MSQANPNIFNPKQSNEDGDAAGDFDYDQANLEMTDDDARNKVRANIYKALANEENEEDLHDKKYPPNTLASMIEEELINEYKESDKPSYKQTANMIVKRLTGNRFKEARLQL